LPLDPEADVVEMPDGTTIPALRGAHAVRDALRAGLPWSGASVHVVTDATDRGRILVRVPCTVAPGTEEASLTAQIRRLEFRAVPDAIRIWLDERARKWEEEHHGR
jgi:phosphoribosylglycinamide formyltransferase-1